MPHRSENLQPSLFEKSESRIELTAAQMVDLAMLVEALLREIAVSLTIGGMGDDQDHV